MKTLGVFVVVPMLAGISLPLAANAQTETLTYTGNPFSQATFGGNLSLAEAYAPAMDAGTIVLSTPLGDNLIDVFVTPESYAFAGGGPASDYLSSASNPYIGDYGNVATFEFSTDATGLLTQWNVNITGGVFAGTNSPSSASITLTMSGDTFAAGFSTPSCAAPPGVTIPCYGISESNISPPLSAAGHWQQTIAPQAPEIDPGMAGSALTLLAGLGALVRGRRAALSPTKHVLRTLQVASPAPAHP
jgi:hypothetical protein